jgi:parvulin-like peptidyl-prolyl isomerase
MRAIFFITVSAFLLGSVVGLGSYMFGEQKYAGSVAVVNGVQIPEKFFHARYGAVYTMLEQQPDMSPEVVKALRNQILELLIQEELLWQKSEEYGIIVTDTEVARNIQSDPMFSNEAGRFDPNIYFYFLNSIRQTPKDFENLRKRQIAGEKLKILLASTVKMSDDEYNDILKITKSQTAKAQLLNNKINAYLNVWFKDAIENSKIKITLRDGI